MDPRPPGWGFAMRTKRRKWFVWAAAFLLGVAAVTIIWRLAGPITPVTVTHPQRRRVVELVIASGRLRARTLSNVGSEVVGTVQDVLVREGDRAKEGQTLITLERTDAEQQLEQTRLAEETARRQLDVVQRGPLPEEVARAKAQLAQAQRVGKAKVASAQQHLNDLLKGGRAAERRRAQAQLAQATATRVQADSDLARAQRLAAQGAIAASDLDKAVATAKSARAAEAAAQQSLALANQPSSSEQIAGAQADLQAAQADYQESTRVAQQNLELVLRGPRIEDVRLAQARLTEAQAAVKLAQEQLAKRIIESPITGIVTTRSVEPGQSVNPGQTLLVVTDLADSEIYVDADETDLPKLKVGQSALIVPPSFPDEPFHATLSQIGPEVDTERGIVGVRLRPVSLPAYARPDMTLDANIEVADLPSVLSVPTSSLLEQGTAQYVLVVQNGRAQRQDVNVLARGAKYVGLRGITPDDSVIVNASGINPGDRVRVTGGG